MTGNPTSGKARIDAAIRIVMARHSGEDMLDPDALRAATAEITGAFADAGLGDGTGLEDLPEEAAEALDRMKTASPADLARLLRGLAELSEQNKDAPQSLEDLANWLDVNFGPILSRRFGLEPERETRERIREGARSVIDAALARHGIEVGSPRPSPPNAPGAMTRHRLFWQNFAPLAPGLVHLTRTPAGAEAATRQVGALLAALDLPDRVAISARPDGAQLDFAASPDPAIALILQTILADAPVVPGWQFSVGGHPV